MLSEAAKNVRFGSEAEATEHLGIGPLVGNKRKWPATVVGPEAQVFSLINLTLRLDRAPLAPIGRARPRLRE
jgi:hypothetical protein